MHTYTPPNSIFDGTVTNLLSTLCILIEILSPAQAKGAKSLNGFKFGTFIGRFPSDGATNMAVKGLRGLRTGPRGRRRRRISFSCDRSSTAPFKTKPIATLLRGTRQYE